MPQRSISNLQNLFEGSEEQSDVFFAAVEAHQANAELFWEGLAAMGMSCHVKNPALRIPALTTVSVPEGVDAKAVAGRLLNEYNIEVAGGFGQLAGKVWRVGLMGFNSRRENVLTLLAALKEILEIGD